MVVDMTKTDLQRKGELVVESKFDDIIDTAAEKHRNIIARLKAEPDGANVNADGIAYHQRRLKRYSM
jgi:hypothetical protein